MEIPICTLKAGTKIVDRRDGPLSLVLETEHPEDGRSLIRVIADAAQPQGVRVEITKTSPDCLTEISVGHSP